MCTYSSHWLTFGGRLSGERSPQTKTWRRNSRGMAALSLHCTHKCVEEEGAGGVNRRGTKGVTVPTVRPSVED